MSQEVKVWEFSPYDVEIWYSFDPSISLPDVAKERFLLEFDATIDRVFRAAWRTTLTNLPSQRRGSVLRDLDRLDVADLRENELVLVVSTKDPEARVLRTYEATVEGLGEIYTTAETVAGIQQSAATANLSEDSITSLLLTKLKVDDAGLTSIREKLEDMSISGAIVPRSALKDVEEVARPLITLLPWQTDSIFRERDKLFFCNIGMDGEQFTFEIRELDCPMQFLGETFQGATTEWQSAARVACDTLVKAFAPTARVEDAETKTAVLRHRAGGLILNDSNPARLRVGDVLQPIVRRDDRNGVPTLLEPLSWTFAAITKSDGVKLDANVYSYSGGPGLKGRKNRRTQRILLRVRPKYSETAIRILVQRSDQAQPGCFVYDRDLLTDDFEYLGRTDWRGQFTVSTPVENGGILPEEIRKERYAAEVEARKAAEEAAAAAVPSAEGDVKAAAAKSPADVQAEVVEYDPATDPEIIPLNYPLRQIYIKSGDSVLAKLPMVAGLRPIETAELPDDSRRLQAEAFVRGFQGEILDLIGLRNLLAARIKIYLTEKEPKKADVALADLRRLKNYNEMADELSTIQRKMLDESDESVPRSAKIRIDRMFQTTRDMLQKYLQDDLVAEMESLVGNAGS